MYINNVIYKILSTTASVTSEFSTRIEPGRLSLDTVLPAIMFQVYGLDVTESKDSTNIWDAYQFDLYIFDEDAANLSIRAQAVRDALVRYTGTVTVKTGVNYFVHTCSLDDADFDVSDDIEDPHRASIMRMTFTISIRKA